MKKTPSHFTARVEIEQQISFFSFGFARVSEVRYIHSLKGIRNMPNCIIEYTIQNRTIFI